MRKYRVFSKDVDNFSTLVESDSLNMAESAARGISRDWPSAEIEIYDIQTDECVGVFVNGKRISH